jgi:pimeloyl-ACP methyl ester carboxylesterase
VPETSYAPCGDLSLAYQVFGDGPVELVYAGSFVSHVELFWALPEYEAFMKRLSTFCRVVVFDKAGVGLSDPVPKIRTLDDRAAEIEAVMDVVGFRRAALMGISEGGPAAMVFAATRPERTRALVLTGTAAYVPSNGWTDVDVDPAELRARDLAVGSGTDFEDRGAVELRGVPGTWELMTVNRQDLHRHSAEAKLASAPTPGPRSAMRRSDRAVAVMAKRTPRILRRMSLLSPASRRKP